MNENGPLILIVDDEAHILHVVRMKLSNAGFRVMTAEDGEEGLALAREHRPDLVITDYQMPVLSGLQMCERLRQDEATARTPALMLTARGFSLTKQQMDRTNIVQVMTKPFSPREVLARVQELVGHGTCKEHGTAA